MSVFYTQDISQCFDKTRIDKAAVASVCERLQPFMDTLKQGKDIAYQAILNTATNTDGLEAIVTKAAQIRDSYSDVVICGAGGASLSGACLASIVDDGSAPTMHFLDTIDPDSIEVRLQRLDMKSTLFLVISKSGGTVETLAQCFAFYHHARSILGDTAAANFLVITTPSDSTLLQFAKQESIEQWDYTDHVGGRFSPFISVGLLPAAIAGVDIAALQKGAASVVNDLHNAEHVNDCDPAVAAALHYSGHEAGYGMRVTFPYSSRLAGFSWWCRQSWAESLGKNGVAATAIRAVGPTDQHSQLQLYLDGAKDKLFTYITCDRTGSGAAIHAPKSAPEFLHGKTLGDVMHAQQTATLQSMITHGCPVNHISVDALDEATLGALIMHTIIEVFCCGFLHGINPLDQPAVEHSKKLTQQYLMGTAS